MNEYLPNTCSAPGGTIRETMEVKTAESLGLSTEDFQKLLTGELPITTDLANRLGALWNIPASFWLNRQTNYERCLQRNG